MRLFCHPADRRSFAYITAITAVAVLHWRLDQWSAGLFAVSIAGAFAVSTMHHNHSHYPIWRSRALNLLTDYWFTFFQGHPGFAFQPLHVGSHHEFHNGRRDLTRTYRFRDGNDLTGLLRHPFEFSVVALGEMAAYLRGRWSATRLALLLPLSHYALLLTLDTALACLDWRRALYCVLLPQLAALFFLLASNYLQHAGAQGESEWNHSRNFLGWINPLFFNVGYHTAHHFQPDAHWSELPAIHRSIEIRISRALVEPTFSGYCWKNFLLHRGRPHMHNNQ